VPHGTAERLERAAARLRELGDEELASAVDVAREVVHRDVKPEKR